MVYPEGVCVKADLAAYQAYDALFEENDNVPNCSRCLIFSRRDEAQPSLNTEYFYTGLEDYNEVYMEKRRSNDYGYTTTLRPDLMEALFSTQQAWSWDECTAVILLEEGYFPNGGFRIHSIGEYLYTTYELIRAYSAYGVIAVYDKSNPLTAVFV